MVVFKEFQARFVSSKSVPKITSRLNHIVPRRGSKSTELLFTEESVACFDNFRCIREFTLCVIKKSRMLFS